MKKQRATQTFNPLQLSFEFNQLPMEKDRNFHLGGRSFYFFDFDDNLVFLQTTVILFHKYNQTELELSSGEFARIHRDVGVKGPYQDYFLDFNDEHGTFRNCRDQFFKTQDINLINQEKFVRDIEHVLKTNLTNFKAPSWDSFYHATYNHRPVSIITARGHQIPTIKTGIDKFVERGHLPHSPNYLTIYPVSNIETRIELGDHHLNLSVAELKKLAIRKSVEKAIEIYGYSPYHRFGMSDDDFKNIELITEEMRALKRIYPEMTFYVIETQKDSLTKFEILEHETREFQLSSIHAKQLSLF